MSQIHTTSVTLGGPAWRLAPSLLHQLGASAFRPFKATSNPRKQAWGGGGGDRTGLAPLVGLHMGVQFPHFESSLESFNKTVHTHWLDA